MALRVEVIRSPKRRKTVQAREVDGVVLVSIPATMSKAEERRWVDEMVRRMERRRASDRVDLSARAKALSRRYRLPLPTTIRWVDNQTTLWGSCTPVDGSVRVSSTVASFPAWVVDYVIVHELAHLLEPGHGTRFWNLVNRYPLAERARGYLLAKESA